MQPQKYNDCGGGCGCVGGGVWVGVWGVGCGWGCGRVSVACTYIAKTNFLFRIQQYNNNSYDKQLTHTTKDSNV